MCRRQFVRIEDLSARSLFPVVVRAVPRSFAYLLDFGAFRLDWLFLHNWCSRCWNGGRGRRQLLLTEKTTTALQEKGKQTPDNDQKSAYTL